MTDLDGSMAMGIVIVDDNAETGIDEKAKRCQSDVCEDAGKQPKSSYNQRQIERINIPSVLVVVVVVVVCFVSFAVATIRKRKFNLITRFGINSLLV